MFIKGTKRYRVYFNRRSEAPQIWSIDEGDLSTEINVQWFSIFGNVEITTHCDMTLTEEQGQTMPMAWLEFDAKAEMTQGGVVFRA